MQLTPVWLSLLFVEKRNSYNKNQLYLISILPNPILHQ
nr:MAG TPA: hypothetical protein [Caudoviricetes sp.]